MVIFIFTTTITTTTIQTLPLAHGSNQALSCKTLAGSAACALATDLDYPQECSYGITHHYVIATDHVCQVSNTCTHQVKKLSQAS